MIRTAIVYALVDMCIDLIEKKIKQNVNVLSPREQLRQMGLSDASIDTLIRLHGDSVLDIANIPIPPSSWHTWNNGDVVVINLDMNHHQPYHSRTEKRISDMI